MKRREFVANGTGSIILGTLGAQFGHNRQRDMSRSPLKTGLCEILGIQYPIIQAGMGGVAGTELVAAVSNAGGLGILGGTMVPPDTLRNQIKEIRSLTDKPFGVNLLLQKDLFPPREHQIDSTTADAVHTVLNTFRKEMEIPESYATPTRVPPLIEKGFQVILEEKVPVFSIGLGLPTSEMVTACRTKNIQTMAMVCTLEDAVEMEKTGVDCIVAQGSEAGGHRSTWVKKASGEHAAIGTLALVSQMCELIEVPVIAAGGIATGRDMAAALMLGAQGILAGTCFITAKESLAPDFYKKAIIASSSDSTTITDVFTGMYARVLRNTFSENYRASGAPVLPPGIQLMAAMDIYNASEEKERPEYYTLYSGQGIDHIKSIRPAGELISELVQDAERTMATYALRD